jgi:hypothetical protein
LNSRSLWLSTLCLGLMAGCARSASPESAPMNQTPKSSASPSDIPGQPAEADQPKPTAYHVRDSGIRCFAPPCPSFLAVPSGKSDAEGLQIHEVDFSEVNAPQDQRDSYMAQAGSQGGLKVEATIAVRQKAGPAGDATVLRVRRVFE